jgi:hypothetical protein
MIRFHPRLLIPAGLVALAASAGAVAVTAADVLAQFKLTRPAAETHVFDAVWNQGLGYFGAGTRLFKTMPGDARAAAVTAGAEFAKAYTQTEDFRARYARQREANRPTPPPPAKSYKEQQAEQRAQFDKSLAEMKASAAKAAPDMRKLLEETAASLQAQQAAMDKDTALQAQMEQGHNMMAEMKQQHYLREVKEYEQGFPQNPQQLIATRLRAFLAVSATVPAQAALVERDGKLRFVDRRFEGQNDFWKQLYRAGKPAVDAAREAATRWLAELEPKQTM